ncbi:hypothetical protein LCGC14_1138120, partial [marine sediment metagenome]
TYSVTRASYPQLADFTMDSTPYGLTKDGLEHTFKETFEFDSASRSGFDIKFDISNGLLELQGMEYTFIFKAIDTTDKILLGQNFNLEFNDAIPDALKNVAGLEYLLFYYSLILLLMQLIKSQVMLL